MIVCPSGIALATISAPIAVAAPGRLSTTTACPPYVSQFLREHARDDIVATARRYRHD
jgi:hypothetical protein